MSSLFRREAIEAQQTRWTGEAANIRPVRAWTPVLFLLAIAVAGAIFLFIGSYARKERVSGVIAPAEGVIRIRAPESAVIVALPVRDGQEVQAGELIAEVSRERFVEAGAASKLVDRSLEQQGAQLLRQLQEQTAAANATSAGLTGRIRRAVLDMQLLDEEMRLQEQNIAAAERVVANLKPLADDRIISDLQFQQQVAQLLDQKGRLLGQKRAREALRLEVQTAQSELDSLRARLQADSAITERARLVIEQERMQRRSDNTVRLLAPVAGVVTSLVGTIGQRMDPNMAIAALVPANATLQAVLYVPSNAVGFIRPGQRVNLRYDAFPFEKFGQYLGTVIKVSEADVVGADQEVPQQATKDRTLYRVRVNLDRDRIDAYGNSVKLRPGLTMQADIELERRRLIEWMFDPLLAIGKKL